MDKLRRWIAREGVTQSELASRLDVHESAISQWLNGHSRPSLDSLRKLSSETGISLDDLARDIPAERVA